jgi:hypothetical protein
MPIITYISGEMAIRFFLRVCAVQLSCFFFFIKIILKKNTKTERRPIRGSGGRETELLVAVIIISSRSSGSRGTSACNGRVIRIVIGRIIKFRI